MGYGSSKVLEALPHAVGWELNVLKLRFCGRTSMALVNGDVPTLPFKAEVLDAVTCPGVVPQIRDDPRVLGELRRC